MSVELERAAWLASDLLLLVGRLGRAAEGGIEAAAVWNGDRVALDARSRLLEPDNGAQAAPKRIVIARFPGDVQAEQGAGGIEIGSGRDSISIDAQSMQRSIADWRAMLADLADCDGHYRVAVLGAIVRAAAPSLLAPGGFSLARRLAALREELMPHMPSPSVDSVEPQALGVDGVLGIDDGSVVVSGWMHDADRDVVRLTAVSPESSRAELLDRAFRHARPDLRELYSPALDVSREKHGFVCFFELETPSLLPRGWTVELVTSSRGIEARAPEVVRDVDVVRGQVLNLLKYETIGSRELMENHVHPALDRLQDRLASLVEIDAVLDLGRPPRSPVTSIVVPLYKRIDFLQYQIALFSEDPQMHDAELIYVLDSPELAEQVDRDAHELHTLYGLPFRLAIMNRNAGFANVNNAAASIARGRRLLLLNSDVIPDRPGWLDRMTELYGSTPDVGALGPKLVYEDGALQHAGMYFEWDSLSEVWENLHYYKGLDRDLPAANVARAVPAVTGACMMIDRELYESVGGLPHVYVQGGYEDSHLCLRLMEEGRRNWYVPEVELYHLEAQSYVPTSHRPRYTRYNAWLQTRLWEDRLQALSDEFPAGGSG